MGASASFQATDRVTLEQATTLATAANVTFDEAKFSEGKDDDNCISGEYFLAQVKLLAPAPDGPAPDGPAPDALPAVDPNVLAKATCPLTDLEKKIEELQGTNKTVIVVDRSASHLVDTFYGYSGCRMLDAKKVSLELAKKNTTKEEAHKELNDALTSCLKQGRRLVLSCCNSVPSFSTSLDNEIKWPSAAIFKNSGKNLHSNSKEYEKLFSEEAIAMPPAAGMAFIAADFNIVITSHFSPDDLEEFFFDEGMGFDKFPRGDFVMLEIEHKEGEPMMD